jgi:hypothetical protein
MLKHTSSSSTVARMARTHLQYPILFHTNKSQIAYQEARRRRRLAQVGYIII